MIILDFLIFYLTGYFSDHKDQLKWSTPIERAIYALGLVTMLWVISILEIVYIFILKDFHKFHAPLIPGVIIGLLSMALYKFMYVNKGRYQHIKSSKHKLLSNNNNSGKVISIIFVLFSFVLPYAIFMIFTN